MHLSQTTAHKTRTTTLVVRTPRKQEKFSFVMLAWNILVIKFGPRCSYLQPKKIVGQTKHQTFKNRF